MTPARNAGGAPATSGSDQPRVPGRQLSPIDYGTGTEAEAATEAEAESVAAHAAGMFKALADPRRLQLVVLARQAPGGEICFCDLIDVFPLPQSSLSHHLRVLVEAGVLERERRGTWSWYRPRLDAVAELADCLSPDGVLHRALRREHAANPKLIADAATRAARCEEPAPGGT